MLYPCLLVGNVFSKSYFVNSSLFLCVFYHVSTFFSPLEVEDLQTGEMAQQLRNFAA